MSDTRKSPSRKTGHYQRFNIEGLEYAIVISKSGSVSLDLLGGVTKQGSAHRSPCKDLFWDEPRFEDVDLGINTFKVFSMVKRVLLRYVFTKKPGRIGFSASTGRKAGVYRWMAGRLARQLKNYNLVEYPAGVFNFYKQAQPAWSAAEEVGYVHC